MHTFLIAPNHLCPYDILIGMDLVKKLIKKGQSITIDRDGIAVGETNVMENSIFHINGCALVDIRACERMTIPPRSEFVCYGENKCLKNKKDHILVQEHPKIRMEFVLVARSLGHPTEEQKVLVRLFNPGRAEVVIEEGEIIAAGEFVHRSNLPTSVIWPRRRERAGSSQCERGCCTSGRSIPKTCWSSQRPEVS